MMLTRVIATIGSIFWRSLMGLTLLTLKRLSEEVVKPHNCSTTKKQFSPTLTAKNFNLNQRSPAANRGEIILSGRRHH